MHTEGNHNPVSIKTEHLQQLWIKALAGNAHKQFVRIMVHYEDHQLAMGFLKLESSSHGSVQEYMACIFTGLDNYYTYSYRLLKDFFLAMKQNEALEQLIIELKEKYISKALPDQLKTAQVASALTEFYQLAVPDKSRRFFIGIIPQYVKEPTHLMVWMKELLQELPPYLGIATIDFYGQELWEPVVKKLAAISHTISCGNLHTADLVRQMATAGDKSKPDVQLRNCIYQMADATKEQNIDKLEQWGQKAIGISIKSGDDSMYVSAHIVFAGYLLNFKKDRPKAIPLLDRAAAKSIQAIRSGKGEFKIYHLQALSFKASLVNMEKEKTKALTFFDEVLDKSMVYGLFEYGMNMAAAAMQIAIGFWGNSDQAFAFAEKGYHMAKKLPEIQQRNSTLVHLASVLVPAYRRSKNPEGEALELLMVNWYGNNWQANAEKNRKASKSVIETIYTEPSVKIN